MKSYSLARSDHDDDDDEVHNADGDDDIANASACEECSGCKGMFVRSW